MLPALLSTLAVGSAAAARGVVGQLLPWLFLGSVGFLAYAHYWVWVCQHGHRTTRWILIINTLLVAYLWSGRVQVWVERWLSY
ncbi:MAG: hypothetical protein ACE5H2_09595 [Terriglobia bacterium]